jgi:hypothetical protein
MIDIIVSDLAKSLGVLDFSSVRQIRDRMLILLLRIVSKPAYT